MACIVFYDVKERKKVSIPSSKVTYMTRITKKGRKVKFAKYKHMRRIISNVAA